MCSNLNIISRNLPQESVVPFQYYLATLTTLTASDDESAFKCCTSKPAELCGLARYNGSDLPSSSGWNRLQRSHGKDGKMVACELSDRTHSNVCC